LFKYEDYDIIVSRWNV